MKQTALQRIIDRTYVDDDGCWNWTGCVTTQGYGQIRSGRKTYVHIAAWEIICEPIGDGLELDHLCRNRACWNPSHLEPVTHAENVRRGESGQHQARKTHCPSGHAYSPGNTLIYGGRRFCLECKRKRQRDHAARKRAAA